jgi:hypothetical protein
MGADGNVNRETFMGLQKEIHTGRCQAPHTWTNRLREGVLTFGQVFFMEIAFSL